MITVANRIYVNAEYGEAFEQRFRERPHLPDLALSWLAELASVGLPPLDPDRQAPLKQADPDRPVVDRASARRSCMLTRLTTSLDAARP